MREQKRLFFLRKLDIIVEFDFVSFTSYFQRGNSFFKKFMGVLRTSSSPISGEKEKNNNKLARPREAYLEKRRRSNTFNCEGDSIHLSVP